MFSLNRLKYLAPLLTALVASVSLGAQFTMDEVLRYPYVSELAAAADGDAIAWVRNISGVRNVWVARGPDFTPQQVTQYTEDDGQEITHLTFSPDGARLVYVRGGDHDANWPAEGNLAPDPASSPEQPLVTIWGVSVTGGAPTKITEGDTPAISARGQLAYIKEHQVWTAPLDGQGKPERLFFDRGKDDDLQWSPDGALLAFVSDRGIMPSSACSPPRTGRSSISRRPRVRIHRPAGRRTAHGSPLYGVQATAAPQSRCSPARRSPGRSGSPAPRMARAMPCGKAPTRSPAPIPDVEGKANLHWAAGDRLVFLAVSRRLAAPLFGCRPRAVRRLCC